MIYLHHLLVITPLHFVRSSLSLMSHFGYGTEILGKYCEFGNDYDTSFSRIIILSPTCSIKGIETSCDVFFFGFSIELENDMGIPISSDHLIKQIEKISKSEEAKLLIEFCKTRKFQEPHWLIY